MPAPTFASSMKQGFGFGVGSSIAHTIVGNLLPKTPTHTKKNCDPILSEYNQCFTNANCTHEQMETLSNELKQCIG